MSEKRVPYWEFKRQEYSKHLYSDESSILRNNIMEKAKSFFNSSTSNLVGVYLGGSLIGGNAIELNVISIIAGLFLINRECIQYFERERG